MASSRTRIVCGVTATVVALSAPAGFAATKKKHAPKKPSGPVPGTVLWQQAGSFQHAYPRLTQAAWTANSCGGTTVGPEDTNNFSASVVDVSKWAGQHLDVTFTPDAAPVNASVYNLSFFDASCNEIDVNDGKSGQWKGQAGSKTSQLGMIPAGAKWLMLQGNLNSTQYQSSLMGVAWQITVRVPQPTEKAAPMAAGGGVPV